jgi:hypothetical protein
VQLAVTGEVDPVAGDGDPVAVDVVEQPCAISRRMATPTVYPVLVKPSRFMRVALSTDVA